jgi:oxygen-independent coproporphyrinogen-3 oxidase
VSEPRDNRAHARESSWHVTAELLERYDRPGPRYTSYPTAVEFHEGFDRHRYEQRLAAADLDAEAPFSLYVHLPFCEHRCLFCGCNVIISPDKTRAAPYLDLVRREVSLLAARLRDRRTLAQVHLGGGTPTYFSPQDLTGLLRDVFSVFRPRPGAELAVEIDPRVTTREHLDALAEIGFNRISLGVQDVNLTVQKAIGRVQSVRQTAGLIEHARSLGYTGINVDLIYGLPEQTPEGFARTVDTVVAMDADRSAVYSFAYVPWMHGQMKRLSEDALPDRSTKLALFAVARERFLAAGYESIGMDHFAKPDDELAVAKREGRLKRNFQGYCVVPAEDVLGLGISAIGDVAGAYVQNAKKLSTYREAVTAGRLPVERGVALDGDDVIRRHVIHSLMCNFAIDVPDVERRFGIEFTDYFHESLARLAEHESAGMVSIDPRRRIEATPVGEMFVRNLAMCFDEYQRKRDSAAAVPFSRTV